MTPSSVERDDLDQMVVDQLATVVADEPSGLEDGSPLPSRVAAEAADRLADRLADLLTAQIVDEQETAAAERVGELHRSIADTQAALHRHANNLADSRRTADEVFALLLAAADGSRETDDERVEEALEELQYLGLHAGAADGLQPGVYVEDGQVCAWDWDPRDPDEGVLVATAGELDSEAGAGRAVT